MAKQQKQHDLSKDQRLLAILSRGMPVPDGVSLAPTPWQRAEEERPRGPRQSRRPSRRLEGGRLHQLEARSQFPSGHGLHPGKDRQMGRPH